MRKLARIRDEQSRPHSPRAPTRTQAKKLQRVRVVTALSINPEEQTTEQEQLHTAYSNAARPNVLPNATGHLLDGAWYLDADSAAGVRLQPVNGVERDAESLCPSHPGRQTSQAVSPLPFAVQLRLRYSGIPA